MSSRAASSSDGPDTPVVPRDDDDCPLPVSVQRRNMICFAGIWCLYYFVAPVVYVGLTHGNFIAWLGGDKQQSNLPGAFYQWLGVVPILVAWTFPQRRFLKPFMTAAFCVIALATALVAVSVNAGLPKDVVLKMVILHGAMLGAANGVALTTMWEMIRRGVSTSRRGPTLALTFGFGPVFACVGSLYQQALTDKIPLLGWSFGTRSPTSELALFATAVPVLLICALLSTVFRIPGPADTTHGVDSTPESDARRERSDVEAASAREAEPAPGLTEIVAGLASFFSSRALMMGAVTYFLVYSGGNAIFTNVSLHAKTALATLSEATDASADGRQTVPSKAIEPADTQGIQQFLRFGFKAIAGALLGWLLARSNAKTPLIATTLVLILGVAWALCVTGPWYLISAGILGAGELFGAYFPNYIATASPKHRVRLNIAYLSVASSLVGFANVIFGWIADRAGLLTSFAAALAVLGLAIALIVATVPARPTPDADA